jgi:hypothetical protein
MNVGLRVTYLYHDVDVIEVRVTAGNERFRGSTNVYVETDGLLGAAAALKGFPNDHKDKREIMFGLASPKFRRDVKLAAKRGKNMDKLRSLILSLVEGEELPPQLQGPSARAPFTDS